ncbi:MAG: CDP-alcohol phosphatidyltransferase family protein [Candidatus Diapherotrites archaeon]|nr:CDP-alcohol phosphatidyltransferase family protein [Candidatus Diapherotrites archaeon]
MVLGRLRNAVNPLKHALAAPFIAFQVHPNTVSLLGIPLAVIAAYFIAVPHWGLALVFLVLTPIPDFVDGTVARSLNLRSNWGNYLQTVIDRVIELILFAGFSVHYSFASVLALGFGALSSYAKARVGLVIVTDNRDWPAMGENADKKVLLMLGVALSLFVPRVAGVNVIEGALYVAALISFTGTVQRMLYAKKLIKEAEQKGHVLPYIKEGKER